MTVMRLFLFSALALFIACSGEKQPTLEEARAQYESAPDAETGTVLLEQYKAKIKADPGNEANKDYLNKAVQVAVDHKIPEPYIEAVEAYADANPQEQRVPEYLYSAAEVAKYVGDLPKALELYDEIYNNYSNHPKAPISLFLKALIYDDDLKDIDQARKLYKEFLNKYPDNAFADDAQLLLNNLGRSDEEILEEIMKLQKEKEAEES